MLKKTKCVKKRCRNHLQKSNRSIYTTYKLLYSVLRKNLVLNECNSRSECMYHNRNGEKKKRMQHKNMHLLIRFLRVTVTLIYVCLFVLV